MGKWIAIIIAAVVIIGGGYWYWQSQQSSTAMSDDGTPAATDAMEDMGQGTTTTGAPAQSSGSDVNVSANVGTSVNTGKTVTVTFNGDAFSPKTVTINKGDTVNFVSTGGQMWVASNPHPIHNGYSGTTLQQHCPDTSGTAFDECSPGTSYSMTFQKVGSWGYHDHLNSGLGGTVVVQ